MLDLPSILDFIFWWIGLVTCVTGGLSLFLRVQWSLLEIICKYLGFNRKIIEVLYEIYTRRRKKRPDGRL